MLRILLALLMTGLLSTPTQAQRASPETARFVASSRGTVYYWIGCDGWRRLRERNRLYFRTAADADSAGYKPSTARGCAPQFDTALIVPTPNGSARCVVSRIVDGDTFACAGGSRVRLLITDADERGQSILADSAALLLERLMPPGSKVRLEFDVQGHDRYRRVLAYVYAGDVFVNHALVRRGYARVVVYPPNVQRVDELRAASDSARNERLGVWSSSAFSCEPGAYRARRCD